MRMGEGEGEGEGHKGQGEGCEGWKMKVRANQRVSVIVTGKGGKETMNVGIRLGTRVARVKVRLRLGLGW